MTHNYLPVVVSYVLVAARESAGSQGTGSFFYLGSAGKAVEWAEAFLSILGLKGWALTGWKSYCSEKL